MRKQTIRHSQPSFEVDCSRGVAAVLLTQADVKKMMENTTCFVPLPGRLSFHTGRLMRIISCTVPRVILFIDAVAIGEPVLGMGTV